MKLSVDRIDSPIGTLLLVWNSQALLALDFGDHEPRFHRLLKSYYGDCHLNPDRVPGEIRTPIEEYFRGDLKSIENIPVSTHGTPFQQQVWSALRDIPAGSTTSYGTLAARLGRPGASRAVGLANGSNPIGIVLPCHRVIGANGALTGYGGGIHRKRWLLEHEQAGLLPLAATY